MKIEEVLKNRPDKKDYCYQRQAYVEDLEDFVEKLIEAINFTGSSLELKKKRETSSNSFKEISIDELKQRIRK